MTNDKSRPLFSIITVVFNRREQLGGALKSLYEQDFSDFEHIIIDGGSSDGTLDLLYSYDFQNREPIIISEPDNGLYDALNKGIKICRGQYIGVLHSDDSYFSCDVLSRVSKAVIESNAQLVFADAVFVKKNDGSKIYRRYSSQNSNVQSIKSGLMPAHTSLFIAREVYEEIGLYNLKYKIASDFDFVARTILSERYQIKYCNEIWIKMTGGGVSTSSIKTKIIINREVVMSLREHGVDIGSLFYLKRYLKKLSGYLHF